uniref:Uncharacterized protein n=1 Tax=Arundo donax TaxID=35708 RepID=A0A0A9AF98_ARUDO
MAGPMARTC